MVFGDVPRQHEAAAVEAIHQPRVTAVRDAGEEVAGEVAAFDFETETVAQQAVEAAEADGIAQAGVEHPEEVAVGGGVVVLGIAAEACDAALRGEEPLREFVRVHAALIGEGLLRQGIETFRKIGRLSPPAVEEGGDLAEAFFELGVRAVHPAPAHPGLLQFEPAGRFEHLGHKPLFIEGERRLQGFDVLRQLATHAVQLLPHGLANDFRVVVEQLDEVAQMRERGHGERWYHGAPGGCNPVFVTA